MKLHRLGLISAALATALTGSVAYADSTQALSINHDIKFGGVITDGTAEWHWNLPQAITTINLERDAATNAAGSNTWDILQNQSNPIRLLEGYMDATLVGAPLENLSPLITYVQGGTTLSTTTASGVETVELEAESADGTKGVLALSITPVLLASNGAAASGALTVQPMPNLVASPNTAVPTIYNYALTKLETKIGDITGATSTTYLNTALPGTYLDNGQTPAEPVIAGYASGITAGALSFPDTATPTSWSSTFTVQVAYN